MEKRPSRWLDGYCLIFLVAALGLSAGRLEITGWVEDLKKVDYSLLSGFVLGAVIGYSVFRRRTAAWMCAFYAIVNLVWQTGMNMSNQLIWSDRISILINRLSSSSNAFITRRPVTDPLLFLSAMILLFWMIGFLGGFEFLRTGKPWLSLAMASVCIVIIDPYPPQPPDRIFIDGAFFLFGLLFICRMFFLFTKNDWMAKRKKVDMDVNSQSILFLIVLVSVAILISWSLPLVIETFTPGSAAHQKWVQFWEPINVSLSNGFASLKNNQLQPTSGVFSDQLGLGNTIPTSDETLFLAHISAPLPGGLNYYWRVRSYDIYQNEGWNSSYQQEQKMDSGITYPEPAWVGRVNRVITIDVQKPMASIVGPNYPLLINYPLYMISAPGEFLNAPQNEWEDILSLMPIKTLQEGDQYRIVSFINTPVTVQLQQSTNIYPDSIKEHYLQLPKNISPRFVNLAQKLTAGLSTPYDKAVAITDYIRKTIVYSGVISNPPRGIDPVEWALFDNKKGYCNYDASADILLLRTIGIPARLAVGYAQGEAIPGGGGFRVREKDLHAWVEVYFPEMGWVEFEPTPIEPERQYLVPVSPGNETTNDINSQNSARKAREAPDNPKPISPLSLSERDQVEIIRQAWIYNLGLFLFVLIILMGGIRDYTKFVHPRISPIIKSRVQRMLKPAATSLAPIIFPLVWYINARHIERVFIELRWMIVLFGERIKPSQTATEQAGVILKYVPEAENEMRVLLDEYQRSLFSQREGDIWVARKARNLLWKRVISNRIRRWINPRMRI